LKIYKIYIILIILSIQNVYISCDFEGDVKYVTFRKCEHSKKVVVFRASEWTRVFSGTVV